MKLSTTFLSAVIATSCEDHRDNAIAANPIDGGSWNCSMDRKYKCTASCDSGRLAQFKKYIMNVKCSDGSTSFKTKPFPGTPATLECNVNQCDVDAENENIADGSLTFKKIARKNSQTQLYKLQCDGDAKAKGNFVKCNPNTGVFESPRHSDFETTCKKGFAPEKYYCDFTGDSGTSSGDLSGVVLITGSRKKVKFTGSINSAVEAFDVGAHGFHVHATGSPLDSSAGQCKGAGGHFSVGGQIHGAPSNKLPERHVGDIGNLDAVDMGDSRSAEVNFADVVVSLDPESAHFIGDKSIVVHANGDDHNPDRDPSSTGAAGSRPGCCTIRPIQYTCDFVGGNIDVSGSILLKYEGDNVRITGTLTSSDSLFSDGNHGFHVHSNADTGSSCSAAGGHFKWTVDQIHGSPSDSPPDRHTGDLGNILVASQSASVDILDNVVSLIEGENHFIGDRAIVLHASFDDGNPEDSPTSTGAAGARLGCCILNKV